MQIEPMICMALFPVLLTAGDSIDLQLETKGLADGTDYEKITSARKLAPTEFTVHPQLGYITLTRKLQNDEALAVAYEYTYNGRRIKLGNFQSTMQISKTMKSSS